MGSIPSCGIHSRCRKDTSLDGLVVLSTFDGPIKTIITEAKYQGYFAELHAVSPALSSVLQVLPTRPQVIVPVPLFRDKLDQRGFNQSWILTRDLSTRSHIPAIEKLLIKKKRTASQAGLSKKLRLSNVADSFSCTHAIPKTICIAVIDDVVTTGATLSACAKVLKKAGAGKVFGISLAHGK